MFNNYLYETDVLVIGAGISAMCAALSAKETEASVIVLEKSPEKESGGNSAFSSGAFRFVFNGVEDILKVVPDLPAEEIAITDFGTYTKEQFFDDMNRVTQKRADSNLVERLINGSLETMVWLRSKKIRFVPFYGREAFKINGKFNFWGGLAIEAEGGGAKLIDTLHNVAKRENIKFLYDAHVTTLLADDDGVYGVELKLKGKSVMIKCRSVILATGGFQANTEMRTRYLGSGWEFAKVRGTRYNTGDGIKMAIDIGARTHGHWSGCHAVGLDYNAPEFGDLVIGNGFQKHSYPFGIMVNATGQRFIDEGADFRDYTHAQMGRLILEQPRQFAWQIFDQQVIHLLKDEYRIKETTIVKASTIEELSQKLEGVDPRGFLEYIKKYNEAVQIEIPFNPNIKDGRGTLGLDVSKTNWTNTIEEGPFVAYKVTSGITFTFGGLKINSKCEVLDTFDKPIPGLYAAGELIGGLFYFNYPSGSGLMAGSVFGRVAGEHAAKFSKDFILKGI